MFTKSIIKLRVLAFILFSMMGVLLMTMIWPVGISVTLIGFSCATETNILAEYRQLALCEYTQGGNEADIHYSKEYLTELYDRGGNG